MYVDNIPTQDLEMELQVKKESYGQEVCRNEKSTGPNQETFGAKDLKNSNIHFFLRVGLSHIKRYSQFGSFETEIGWRFQ